VSDERLVMALLAEGNPATEVAEDASTEVPAATYLATLEQRSSDMTQLETKKDEKQTKRRLTTPWLVAAIAVVVLGVAALVVNQAGQQGIPLAGANGDPQAAEAFKAVEAAYNAFNTGDQEWLDLRLRGSFFESQEERDALLAELVTSWPDELAWQPHIEVSGCVSQGHGEWPNRVDQGVPAPTGYYFICDSALTDSFMDVAGVQIPETYHWVVTDGDVVAVSSEMITGEEADSLTTRFESWLRQNHPEDVADILPLFSDPRSVPTVLEYAEEFVAQSAEYPIETSSP
jgi:hypothetical protein